jgi:hypothetical protein
MTTGYELMKYKEVYTKKTYSVIYDDDPVVKILNAERDQLIISKTVFYEVATYLEFTIRKVISKLADGENIDVNGLYVAN